MTFIGKKTLWTSFKYLIIIIIITTISIIIRIIIVMF